MANLKDVDHKVTDTGMFVPMRGIYLYPDGHGNFVFRKAHGA